MTARGWTSIRVSSISAREPVLRALFALGVDGVHEDESQLVTYLRQPDCDRVAAAVSAVNHGARVQFASAPDVDWTVAWRARVRGHRVESLVVTPPWLAHEVPPSDRLIIDPGMAFGTGDHETTRGALRLLQRWLGPGDVVADLGTGSGVLGIAAAKLGARHVFAIDIDPDATTDAEQNAQCNDVADRVTVLTGDAGSLLALVAPVQMVLANIATPILLGLLPRLDTSLSPNGRAVLAGVLRDEAESMRTALRDRGWSVTAEDEEGEWWSVAATRP